MFKETERRQKTALPSATRQSQEGENANPGKEIVAFSVVVMH